MTALSSSEYLVVWAANSYQISAQRVGSSGSVLGSQLFEIDLGYEPAVVAGSGGQALAVWEDQETAGQRLITGQRITNSPDTATAGDLIYVSPYYSARQHPRLTYQSATNQHLLTWDQAEAGPGADVFSLRLDGQGQPAGPLLNVSADPTVAQDQAAVAAGATNGLVVWQDRRNEAASGVDLYARRLDLNGQPAGSELVLSQAAGDQWAPAVVYHPSRDEYLVAWEDEPGGDITYQIVRADGSLGTAGSLTIAGPQGHPHLAYNPSTDQYLVVFHDQRPGAGSVDVYGQFINGDGSLSGSSFVISSASGNQYYLDVAYAANTFLVVWEDVRNGYSNYDLYGQRVSGSGPSLVGGELAISTAPTDQRYPAVAAGGSEFVVVWRDRRNDYDQDIYLQRVDSSGALLDEPDTTAVETNPTVNRPVALDPNNYYDRPEVAYNATEQLYLIAFSNLDDGGVYAQRYTAGNPAAPLAGFSADPNRGVFPLTVTFSDASTGTIGSRDWAFGDGATATTSGPAPFQHTYLQTGTFRVVLTTTNPGGSSTASRLITVTEQITPSLNEDFEGWEMDDDPTFWLDQQQDGTLLDEFEVRATAPEGGTTYNRALGTDYASTGNRLYSSYAIPGWSQWQDYEVSGRLLLSDPAGSVGALLYNRTPAGQARWYVLRNAGGGGYFELAAGGTSLSGTLTQSLAVQANTWYRFRVQVESLTDRTVLRGRVWLDGQPEPGSWLLQGEDATPQRLTAGAVGLRTWGNGQKYLDDLLVSPLGVSSNLQAGFSAFPTGGDAPLLVQFFDNSTGASSYLWHFGDAITSTQSSPTHTYTLPGVYTVTLTVSDGSLTDTLTRTNYITVTPLLIERDWRPITPTTSPPVSGEHAMAYDAAAGRVVLYGGNATGWPYETSTWEFDGSDWSRVTTGQTPQARYGMRTTYLPGQGVILFGGSDETDTALNQTWVYTDSNWSQLTGTMPPARTFAALTSAGDALYLFGGNDGTTYFDDLWKYESGMWSEVAVSSGPSARTLTALTYDPVGERLLLFGGRASDGAILADLWAFDPVGGTWSELDPGGGGGDPPARMAHTLTFDVLTGDTVLVGGVSADGETLLSDTWHYDAGWVQASPTTTLPEQAYHQAVYDTSTNTTILFANREVWSYE